MATGRLDKGYVDYVAPNPKWIFFAFIIISICLEFHESIVTEHNTVC